MKISEKLLMDLNGLIENGPITIAAFGDSVTHGALGTDEINYETVYWNRLQQKIDAVRSYMYENTIKAGIGGITAKNHYPSCQIKTVSNLFRRFPRIAVLTEIKSFC